MKTKKSTAVSKLKKGPAETRSRKMEPLKSKEMKNQHFDKEDVEENEEVDPDSMEDNFKGFEENFDHLDDDDDDY